MKSFTPPSRRPAFSLIELLLVIGIILVLVTIVVVAGGRVLSSRQEAATQQIITGLDGILETYIQERGGVPPYNGQALYDLWQQDVPSGSATAFMRAYYGDTNDTSIASLTDITPVTSSNEFIRPSSALFTYLVRGTTGVDDALGKIPPSQLVPVAGETGMVAVIDSWGDATVPHQRHILYVDPSNERAQQLYGFCQNGRPYFLSAGEDGVYGTIQDLELGERRRMNGRREPFDSNEKIVEFFREARADNITSYEVRPAPIAPDADLQLNPEQ